MVPPEECDAYPVKVVVCTDGSEKESAEFAETPRLRRDRHSGTFVAASRSHRFTSFEVDSSTLRIKHGLIRRSSESGVRAPELLFWGIL